MPVVITGNNTPTAGGVTYGDGSTYANTAAGTSGQLLQSNGASAPTWATVSAGAGDHIVTVHTGNGYGSTNTRIRRFTTTLTAVGTAITYADSASLGGSFTINEAGLYEIYFSDDGSFTGGVLGASINTTQPSTNIDSLTNISERVFLTNHPAANKAMNSTRIMKLAINDVVRAHNDDNLDGTANDTFFSIRKVGSV